MIPGTHDLEDYATYYIPVIHLSYACENIPDHIEYRRIQEDYM